MNKWVVRVGGGLLALLLAVYLGYQAVQVISNPYQIETAIAYSTQDSMRTQGIFVRDETVMDQPAQGVVSYVLQDSARVKAGDVVAEIYPDFKSATNQKVRQALQNEIELLEECQNAGSKSALQADAFNKKINESIGELVEATCGGMIPEVAALRRNITANLNQKQILTGTVDNFNGRIQELKDAQGRLTIAEAQGTVTAPALGYFSGEVDGFEEMLTTEKLAGMTARQIDTLIAAPEKTQPHGVGKIITRNRWSFAVAVDEDEKDKFSQGMQLSLDFDITSFDAVPAVVTRITEPENGRVAVIMEGDYMSAQLAQMRIHSVEINFRRYTGLKLSKEAIHYTDSETWVYKVDGMELKKVPVEVIYEGIGYVICSGTPSETNQISLFDQVITEGTDLYDGKTVR